MKKWNPILLLVIAQSFVLLFTSCSTSWTESLQNGSVEEREFSKNIPMEVVMGVIIVPVQINGKTYRFLFDTGAISSISKEIQEELGFQTVSQGHIKDSDNQRTKVIYVNVDSLLINEVSFYNQTCFVGDFKANPVLRCLELDGILGSNVMRYCNWEIDYEKEEISFSNQAVENSSDTTYIIPFRTDRQYNILINLKTADRSIQNVKVDYGSNGSLSIPNKAFNTLLEDGIITKVTYQKGVSQSGITGKVSTIKDAIAVLDSLYYEDLMIKEVRLASGGKGLLGKSILARYIVDIDWDEQLLHLTPQKSYSHELKTTGLGIGYSEKKGTYVQTVIDGSSADENGIQPHMKIIRIGDIHFNTQDDFCEYIHQASKSDQIDVELVDQNGENISVTLYNQPYNFN